MPKTREAKRWLKLEFETVRTAEAEDPLDLLSRPDKAADKLAMLGDGKSEEEVNPHIVPNISSLLTLQKKSILSRPGLHRSDINEITRSAYTDVKVAKGLTQSAMAVQG